MSHHAERREAIQEAGTAAARQIKDRQRKHWNVTADGWAAWLEWIERNFAPVTAWLARACAWQPGARVLDVACGAGYPSLHAAAAVRPGGSVAATDISPEMLAVASRRAAERGLGNIEFREMDAEHLDVDGQLFDAVSSAYGLMFCPDPRLAIREAHRVLRPAGRCAVVVWDEPSRSPYFSIILGIASTCLSLPPPSPADLSPFRLADPDALAAMLQDSGFAEVRVERVPMTVECASVAEYCQIFADVAWKARLAALPAAEAARFRDAVTGATRPFVHGDGLRLVATSLCASGRKSPRPA